MNGQKISPTISRTIGSTNRIAIFQSRPRTRVKPKRAGGRAELGEVKFERRWISHGLFS